MFSYLYPTIAATAIFVSVCLALPARLRSPLTKVPGPKHTLLTPLWLMIQEFTSNRRPYIHRLHEKYGPVVRLGPNEVSFASLPALKEIYTSGGSGYDKTEFYTLFMQFNTRCVRLSGGCVSLTEAALLILILGRCSLLCRGVMYDRFLE